MPGGSVGTVGMEGPDGAGGVNGAGAGVPEAERAGAGGNTGAGAGVPAGAGTRWDWREAGVVVVAAVPPAMAVGGAAGAAAPGKAVGLAAVGVVAGNAGVVGAAAGACVHITWANLVKSYVRAVKECFKGIGVVVRWYWGMLVYSCSHTCTVWCACAIRQARVRQNVKPTHA